MALVIMGAKTEQEKLENRRNCHSTPSSAALIINVKRSCRIKELRIKATASYREHGKNRRMLVLLLSWVLTPRFQQLA